MQSEEIEIPISQDQPVEMTFNTTLNDSSKKLNPLEDSKLVIENEPINLEDDIEKVEVSSPSASSSSSYINNDNINKENNNRIVFPGLPDQNPNESIKSWLHRITDLQKKINPSPSNTHQSRVMKFQDLPYMGEMTLDNSKPRRGRKPKKADICHLIYKNYGTIFPGTPNPGNYLDSTNKKDDNNVKSNVQNKIISSLLEKRLTQEFNKKSDLKKGAQDQDEPLNLCIRDLNHLKIRLLKENDDCKNDVKSEPHSGDDDDDDDVNNDNVELVNEETPSSPSAEKLPSTTPDSASTPSPDVAPGGYVYWPNAGVFIHPMALQQHLMYYQRVAANNNYTLPNHSPRPPPINDDTPSQELRKLVPKQETDIINHHEIKSKRPPTDKVDKTPTKRKRSAIFIPPIPTENNTNPATEVSICKFKFTGGAKPSLQEKKMLSVDSGGNFRYYSGTGDKSMRGYEFFPRETLQQQVNNSQGSSTGAFLQASGEKIYPIMPDFTGTKANSDFLLSNVDIQPNSPSSIPNQQDLKQKKRKSRKSLQREKLEQTFKEKGFLIQTQQLESAEGATYCKFRQLRKFTRYLFRSWKDYLPGNVRELQEGEKHDVIGGEDLVVDHDDLSRHSSEFSTTNVQ